MSQVYVVDAGVLFSTWPMKMMDATFATTSNIMVEVRNKPSKLRAEILLILDRMRVANPEDEYVQRTVDAAAQSGDRSVLSNADIELLALALMLSDDRSNVTIVSTDFAVLNTASHLNIDFLDPSSKFKKEIIWAMRCPACGYRSKGPTRDTECPVCGTAMRRTPLTPRK